MLSLDVYDYIHSGWGNQVLITLGIFHTHKVRSLCAYTKKGCDSVKMKRPCVRRHGEGPSVIEIGGVVQILSWKSHRYTFTRLLPAGAQI